MTANTTTGSADVRDRDRARSAPVRRTYTEAKQAFKTTEFYIMLLAVAGVLVATYADEDSLSRTDGWRYAAFIVAAYLVSRGLAKLGTREPYVERYDD
jgi:hypothetical protein